MINNSPLLSIAHTSREFLPLVWASDLQSILFHYSLARSRYSSRCKLYDTGKVLAVVTWPEGRSMGTRSERAAFHTQMKRAIWNLEIHRFCSFGVCFYLCRCFRVSDFDLADLNAVARTVLGSLGNPHGQDAVLEIGADVVLLDLAREAEGATEFADAALGEPIFGRIRRRVLLAGGFFVGVGAPAGLSSLVIVGSPVGDLSSTLGLRFA